MQLDKARKIAEEFMVVHGLADQKPYCWTFAFDNARVRFGLCNYRQKRISLSRHLVRMNSEDRVRDTILHEIAHALAGKEAGHGSEWRVRAREIGCNAQRCYSTTNTVVPDPKIRYVCHNCNQFVLRHKRLPRRKRWLCGECWNKHRVKSLLYLMEG